MEAYHLTLVFNFVMIVYVYYYFFKEYKATNISEQQQLKSMNLAVKLANDVAEEKTNFLSTMSHELRTPLNAVIGMSNLLMIEHHLKAQRENLEVLQFSAQNLMSIINDILDFNKMVAGKIQLRPVA